MTDEQISSKWLCHQRADIFAERVNAGEVGIVCTGVGLSGVPHVGTLSQIIRAIELQRNGVPVQIVLGDVDAYLGKRRDGKIIPLEETRALAKKYHDFIVGLGFVDAPPSILRAQFENVDVMRTSLLLTPYTDHQLYARAEEELHGVYAAKGRVDTDMSPSRMAALLLMTADFLHHPIAAGVPNVLVSLGVDEHQYVRFGQELLVRLISQGAAGDRSLLAGIYTKMTRGLNGAPKMSKSIPGSAITGDMDPNLIYSLIMTGDNEFVDPGDSAVMQMIEALTFYDKSRLMTAATEAANHTQIWEQIKSDFAHYLIGLFAGWPK